MKIKRPHVVGFLFGFGFVMIFAGIPLAIYGIIFGWTIIGVGLLSLLISLIYLRSLAPSRKKSN